MSRSDSFKLAAAAVARNDKRLVNRLLKLMERTFARAIELAPECEYKTAAEIREIYEREVIPILEKGMRSL
jgi:hypothetical protein